MKIEEALREYIEEAISRRLEEIAQQPDLITAAEAAEICGCDKSVIFSLVKNEARFPAIRLGPKTIKIDKQRLYEWLRAGGSKT